MNPATAPQDPNVQQYGQQMPMTPQYPSASGQNYGYNPVATQPPPYAFQPSPTPGYPQPGPTPGFPQPGPTPGFPQPGPTPGYPQPGSAPGYAQPGPAPGYAQPGPAPGYPQPGPAPGYPQPVTVQPQGESWMPAVQPVSNCPPGLEYLTMIDQILVHQKVELLEALTGFETENKYVVKNSMGQKVFYAAEVSDCCTRQCCGPLRPFDMKIVDNFGNEVIHLNRPLACDSCCFPCCLQSMEVTAPPGNLIGSIQQEWSIFVPKFSVKNASGETILKIEGPFLTCSMCGDVDFDVYSQDGSTKVGKISKQWSGFVREAFTDADMFGINFPMDLDVKMKAVLMGACFLIDFMFFEKSGNQERDRPGMWS